MKVLDYIKQGKIFLATGRSRDEVLVEHEGNCYGVKRIYYAFARSLAAASRKLNKIDSVDKCYYEYKEDSKVFHDLNAEKYWDCDLTLDKVCEIASSPFHAEV